MKDSYTNDRGAFNEEDDLLKPAEERFDPIVLTTSTIFHIGQSYADKPVSTFTCKECGGKEFNVGQGEYATAIRCPKCEWESIIHNG